MVELLATVTILGIISVIGIVAVSKLIDRAHEEYYDNQRKNLILAAQAYYNANKIKLPKVIGKKEEITAKELKDKNYLKKSITTYDKNGSCDDSYVRVFKYGQTDYSYTAYLKCDGANGKNEEYMVDPSNVGPTFDEPIWTGDTNGQVGISAVKLGIHGGDSSKKIKLISYSYVISVEKNSKFVELINTGNKAYSSFDMVKNISLSKYTIGKNTKMIIKITATNINGSTASKVFLKNFKDETSPVCEIENKDKINTASGKTKAWNKEPVKVTVTCKDDKGSGCVKDKYTKTFTADNIQDKIKIADNAGNETTCHVTTYIDHTKPKINVVAYKCKNVDGKLVADKSQKVGSKEISSDYTWYSTDFDHDYAGWLNNNNYPNGICFEFEFSDNLALGSRTWSWNKVGQKKDASGYTNQNGDGSPSQKLDINKTIYKTDEFIKKDTYSSSLSGQGHRYAKLEVKDEAGNSTTLTIDTKIDTGLPSCGTATGSSTTWTKSDRTIKQACSDTMSQCVKSSYDKTYSSSTLNDTITIADNAGNTRSCSYNVYVDKAKPTCGDVSGDSTTWTKDNRKITVKCNDTGGSTCVKNSYSTTYDKNTETANITIKDVAGNERNCPVNVYVDKCEKMQSSWHYTACRCNGDKKKTGTKKSTFGSGFTCATTETDCSNTCCNSISISGKGERNGPYDCWCGGERINQDAMTEFHITGCRDGLSGHVCFYNSEGYGAYCGRRGTQVNYSSGYHKENGYGHVCFYDSEWWYYYRSSEQTYAKACNKEGHCDTSRACTGSNC